MTVPNLEFTSLDETKLTSNIDRQIASLIDKTYNVDFEGRSFCHQHHHKRYLAYNSDDLVAHLAILLRSVSLGGERVSIAGVAEVATDQDFRCRGIASNLLAMAIEDAMASTASFMLLFGTENIYRRAGFKNYQNPMTAVDLSGGISRKIRKVENEPLMVLPLKDEEWDPTAPLDLLGSVF